MVKKEMKIGMVGRNVTFDGKYRVNWGSTGMAYNNQSKSFNTRLQAILFKDRLIKKFKMNYKVRYIYIAG